MTTYTLYTNGVLEADGFYMPIDEFNPDYLAYFAWLALGNSPTSRPRLNILQNWTQIKHCERK